MCSIESGLGQKGHLSSEVNFYFSSSFLIVIILPITLKENCSFIFAWMQRSVMKQKINGFLNSQAQVYLSAVCLSAGMRLCEESVICKVASIYSLNSKQVSLWIFTIKRKVKFCSFLFFDWNPVIHFLVRILVVFSWWLTVILSGFVYSFTLAGSNVCSLFDFLVSKQCV